MKPMLFGLVLLLGLAGPARAQDFVVVVNAANPVATLGKDELSRIFLKKTRSWPAGGTVTVVEPAVKPVREAFAQQVHGRSAAAVAAYWQQQIFAGKDTPPAEKPDDAAVLEFVRANPGAIGYVSSGTAPGAGVKTLRVGA